VLAQRLVRRLCSCGAASRRDLLVAEPAPVPCKACHGEGYRGRLAIVELLLAEGEFERQVASGAGADRLAAIARQHGMRSLWESGMAHVALGHTSRAELLRVTAAPARVDSVATAQYLPHDISPASAMTEAVPVKVATVDVYVIRALDDGWRVLTLRRRQGTRCPGSWETVHGSIEAGEKPEAAALREVREEAGMAVSRLYSISVQPFYLHKLGVVTAAVVFAAFVDGDAVTLGDEHDAHEWLPVSDASRRFVWPRSRVALAEIEALLSSGDAGPVEDVLRIV
jgi:8-oxo-dGTP pyrophosphatase MutT (NUDIX family)